MKIFIIICLLITGTLEAQEFSTEVRERVSSLVRLIGDWDGTGWIQNREGRDSSQITESISYGLDSTIIKMEGNGVSTETGKEVHHALGILSYDVFQKKYTMHSFIAKGMQTEANLEILDDGRISWWFDAGPRKIRYTLVINEQDWHEEGEMSTDGENWMKFFEMNLKRIR